MTFFTASKRSTSFFLCALLSLCAQFFCHADSGEVVFASYNLENYLSMERRGGDAPKPEREIAAVVHIVKAINPDILGVCEMGRAPSSRILKNASSKPDWASSILNLWMVRCTAASGLVEPLSDRRRQPLSDVSFTLDGRREKVKRGFLDVTVKITGGCTVRLVGAHLKSKLTAVEGDALLRRTERICCASTWRKSSPANRR